MDILKYLFENVCVFVTIIFIGTQFLKKAKLGKPDSGKYQIAWGIINGLLGIILMTFSVQIEPGIILDFRNLAIIVSAIYSGWISVLITGIVMAAFRLFYLGISYVSINAAVCMIIMMGMCMIIRSIKISKRNQWISMFIATNISYTMLLIIVLKGVLILDITLAHFWIGSIVSNLIAYNLTEYIEKSNATLDRLSQEASIDYLTGLQNVRSFDKSFNELLKKVRERNESISLLAVDIDYFKRINDTYGHASGDVVLKELGEILSKSVRDFDVVARVGGEEFSVILRDCKEAHSIEIAERIRKSVEEHKFKLPCGEIINITVSIGISIYPGTVAELNMLKGKADEKLYEAKHTGRNRVCI